MTTPGPSEPGTPSQQQALRWVALVLALTAFWVAWPLWPALVLAAWTAQLARPLYERLGKVLRGRRRAATVFTLALVVLLLTPLALVLASTLAGASELLSTLSASPSAQSALSTVVSGSAETPLPRSLEEALELVRQTGLSSLGLVSGVAGAAGKSVVGLLLYFMGAFVFMSEGGRAWSWLRELSPLERTHSERLAKAFHETGRGLLIGVGLTSATQGLVATVIYAALGVPRALVLGAMTGLASLVPLVGTGLIWVPLALGLALNGQVGRAVLLAALGLAVIASIDNLLRPFFVRVGALRLHLFVLFLAVFGGLASFGLWGALLGPLVVRLAVEALALLKETSLPRHESETTSDTD